MGAVKLFDQIDPTTLDRRDRELWLLAVGVIFVLGAGAAFLMYPSVIGSRGGATGQTTRTLFVSFCVLHVLMVTYLLEREYVVHALRRRLARQSAQIEVLRRRASADLLGTLAGYGNFQDQLAMVFRRAVQIREPLSLVLVRVQPSPKLRSPQEVSLAMGEAARALVRKLRTGDSLFLLSSGVFGIFLPNTPRPGMNRVAERVAEGLIDASGSGHRFRFDLGMVNYPEQASTAREMEQLAHAFSFGTGSA